MFSKKNYAADKNFTRLPVPAVPPNINSAPLFGQCPKENVLFLTMSSLRPLVLFSSYHPEIPISFYPIHFSLSCYQHTLNEGLCSNLYCLRSRDTAFDFCHTGLMVNWDPCPARTDSLYKRSYVGCEFVSEQTRNWYLSKTTLSYKILCFCFGCSN